MSKTILEQIEIDKTHINDFPLETEEGTKRAKEKFYEKAVTERNQYVEKQIQTFEEYSNEAIEEIKKRYQEQLPISKEETFQGEKDKLKEYFELVKLNANLSDSFHLKLDFLIASIKDHTSLEELNNILFLFIEEMKKNGITLGIEDFQYTMFTEEYMTSFLENSSYESMKPIFEKIFFTCPDLKIHLKMCLHDIIKRHEKELKEAYQKKKEGDFSAYQVDSNTVIDTFIHKKNDLNDQMDMDSYLLSKPFLEGELKIADYLNDSPTREKNFDSFSLLGPYKELDDSNKKDFNEAIKDLYLTLKELKNYYGYQFIVDDLKERYKSKDSIKTTFQAKEKEYFTEEKNRLKILKAYKKSLGIGFLAKNNPVKAKLSKQKINEEILKIHTIYDEYLDLNMTKEIAELNESSSIYDFFITSLKSFSFLEKSFEKDESFSENKLVDNMENYFEFIYHPNNYFLRKMNAFREEAVEDIVSEKYRLLNINITSEMINKEMIDSTMESILYLVRIQNIEKSPISIERIHELCQMKDILKDMEKDE